MISSPCIIVVYMDVGIVAGCRAMPCHDISRLCQELEREGKKARMRGRRKAHKTEIEMGEGTNQVKDRVRFALTTKSI